MSVIEPEDLDLLPPKITMTGPLAADQEVAIDAQSFTPNYDPFAIGGDVKAVTLKEVGDMVAEDGRQRIIITATPNGDGIDWDRTVWIAMPIAQAFSLLCQFFPGFRALEQAAVLGLMPSQYPQKAQEGASDAPEAPETAGRQNLS